MLLGIFSNIYELISGVNINNPEYDDEIYSNVGLVTLVIVLCITILFYLLIGRWRPIFCSIYNWIFTLLLTSIGCGILAFASAKDVIGQADTYMIRFSIMNGVLSAVFFILLSIAMKRLSIFAKRTPF